MALLLTRMIGEGEDGSLDKEGGSMPSQPLLIPSGARGSKYRTSDFN